MWALDNKKDWAWKNDAFELWCWRRLLRVPWTERRSNQSILKEINWIFIGKTDAEVEAPILWPRDAKSRLIGRLWSWERLKAGGEGGDRGWGGWMTSLTQWTWVWASSGRWWRTGKPDVLQSAGLRRVGHSWVTEQQPIGLKGEKGKSTVMFKYINTHSVINKTSQKICKAIARSQQHYQLLLPNWNL